MPDYSTIFECSLLLADFTRRLDISQKKEAKLKKRQPSCFPSLEIENIHSVHSQLYIFMHFYWSMNGITNDIRVEMFFTVIFIFFPSN